MKLSSNHLFLLVFLLCLGCSKRYLNLTDSQSFENVLIDDTVVRGFGPSEPSIAINNSNPNILAVGTILDRVFTSQDGGRNWVQDRLRSPYGVYGDPVVGFGPEGNLYYAHLSDPSGKGVRDERWLDRIVVQRSEDGGLSWNEGTFPEVRHPRDQDKHWFVADQNNGDIFISWTEFDKYGSPSEKDKSRILFSKSVDQAETWSSPLQISAREGDCRDNDNTVEGAVPCLGINGEIFIAWAGHEKIYFDRSTNRGESWLDDDIVAADQPGGWKINIPGIYRCNGMPVTGVDHSKGKYRGRIYINWTDQSNGEDDTDVWIVYSDDNGESWSKPVRVNDDPAGSHQFFSWMAVDAVTGYIYIAFYDRRAYQDLRTDFYLAVSIDGGKSFKNKKISKSPFIPDPSIFFGDYSNIVAHNGIIRPVWTRADGMRLSIWTALIDMK